MATLQREACLIGGEWLAGEQWLPITDPASGAVIGRVPDFGVAETRRAIDAANAALPSWSALTGKERAAILRRYYEAIMDQQDALAELLTAEQGKPLAEARGEIAYAASFIEWFGEEAKRVYGDLVPGPKSDNRILVMRQPIGVVAAITPWNFPAAMITRKIGPALAVGCTVVVKPAQQTPLTALALAALAEQAGVPAGVLNVVTGSDAAAIGGELCANPVVRKLSFTGSTRIGAMLYAQSAPSIKKLSLELGGNAPFIVMDDADIDAAVKGAIDSKFRNAGQTCVCANRIYVQDAVHDDFVARFVAAASRLRVGSGSEEGVEIGPLIEEKAVEKVERLIADAVGKGAHVATGGQRDARGGCFFEPTVLTGMREGMLALEEEAFGPLAPVVRFATEEEVIEAVNRSEFGLAAYVFTRNVSRVWRIAERIESGIVGVNTGLVSTELAPFGGVKASGLGREGSRHGTEDYLEIKYVCLDLESP
ncbi:MAG: NAD-dependent succinate-semialdehyde dehydrogenase [Sphingopyxis sp.]|uniref:NAD-dependent succinate-semialdehyde dehydrogenase n=1 Tax=Sphingopyxis sp. TaxID=1908224 RepID=UPI001A5636CD|nr:NAD-dependent succinate-semialdehyde dehydrogenase [Sphingopyxis sp.]MBL9068487.1 NAD-dependent succinate-semialdehyde dehydrogenase [Sphingopyxis sp.]